MKNKLTTLIAMVAGLLFSLPVEAQPVIHYGYTNKVEFTTTNAALYLKARLVWTTNAINLPSNTIATPTNTTWGYGAGLLTWGVDGGTNYIYQSITTNRWGRVALSTNW